MSVAMKLLADMSWEEVKEYLTHDDRVILPLGAVEEHGRHLGLGTDFIEAEAIAVDTGEASGVAVAPTVNYGVSLAMMTFPGTLSLKPTTLMAVIEDVLRGLYRHGFRRILIVNGHGGNTAAISSAAHVVAQETAGLRIKYFEWWTDAEACRVVMETMGEQAGSHAADAETAFMLAVRPEAVKLARLTGKDAPVVPSRELTTVQTFAQKYPDGIMGNHPHRATREAGEKLLRKSVEICARELANW
jgi:creatinine amidohydrolase